jgi:hypothetical protein
MRIPRALLGSVLWILAGVVGLVGALLCVTLILLPVGIPLLMLARKLFRYSMTLFLPRAVRHPVDEAKKKGRGSLSDAADSVGLTRRNRKKARKKGLKRARKTSKKARKAWARQVG